MFKLIIKSDDILYDLIDRLLNDSIRGFGDSFTVLMIIVEEVSIHD
jgi:hypothetical protein